MCGNCFNGEPCNHVDGSCSNGCHSGSFGVLCDKGLNNQSLLQSSETDFIKKKKTFQTIAINTKQLNFTSLYKMFMHHYALFTLPFYSQVRNTMNEKF